MKPLISIFCLLSLSAYADVWEKPEYQTDENHPPVALPSVQKQAQEESPEEIQGKNLEDDNDYENASEEDEGEGEEEGEN